MRLVAHVSITKRRTWPQGLIARSERNNWCPRRDISESVTFPSAVFAIEIYENCFQLGNLDNHALQVQWELRWADCHAEDCSFGEVSSSLKFKSHTRSREFHGELPHMWCFSEGQVIWWREHPKAFDSNCLSRAEEQVNSNASPGVAKNRMERIICVQKLWCTSN